MTTTLRQVLTVFEQASVPLSLGQVARELGVERGALEGMIDHWVRKGKLRTVSDGQLCSACGGARGCPFVARLPRRYELVPEGEGTAGFTPVCDGCNIFHKTRVDV